MFQRDSLYLLVNAIAPVLAVAAIFAFAAGTYWLAWSCALGVVVCMESRVQFGGRLPRATIFWMHLISAIPFILLLTALAFFSHAFWLVVVTALFGFVALGTGAILWYRGLETRMLHLREWRWSSTGNTARANARSSI